MTRKPFFEVFPTLEIKGKLHDMMEQAFVERVSATKSRDRMSVYLYSTRLILKEDIRTIEREIKNQLFPTAVMAIRIFEHFELSSQYTPENLMEVYGESILSELREYSHIEYNAFRTAQITYPEVGKMVLTIDDTVINHSKEAELVRILEKILVERCGLQVAILVEYREYKTGKFAAEDELKIQLKVNEICRRVNKGDHFVGGEIVVGGNGAEGQGAGGTNADSGIVNVNDKNSDVATKQGAGNGQAVASGEMSGQASSAAGAAGNQASGMAGQTSSAQGGTTKSGLSSGVAKRFQGKAEGGRGEFKKSESPCELLLPPKVSAGM